ncbi:hypothetical protein B6U90_01790 [Thermoplasmatales archaeon ex4484_6]|nr:MAG: hypothetical protein B6U90_01790 [Thermoplasmatales archaeon ex4484_6]RLF69555.1 MAG: hypothetical protein DRN57_00460 [Thermoplasmata archaeon]
MAEQKKKVDYFPDFEFRFFPVVFNEKEMEGIQGPVYRPSGEFLHLGDEKTVGMEQPEEVFHDGSAAVYELPEDNLELEEKVLGYVPCPKCGAQIPVTSEKRPLEIKCPSCGKKGKLE